MTTISRELNPLVDRVATEIMERQAKAKRINASNDPFALLLFRNLCWAGAALGFVFAFGLSCLWWADAITPAVGVIHWFVVGMGLAFLGAVTLQATINQRRTAAGQRRIVERMDAAAVKSRGEIHDLREAVAELAAEISTIKDDAFVDTLSEQEDRPKTNGHNVTRLMRPSSQRDRT